MTTPITKERIAQHIKNPLEYGLTRGEQMEMARMLLAAMDAEPVAYADPQALRNFLAGAARREWMWRNPVPDLIPLYSAPPAPVVYAEPVADVVAWHKEGEERTCDIRLRRFDVAPGPLFAVAQTVAVDNTFIPKNLDRALGVVGVALPESKEEFNFQIERWIQRLIDRVIRYADEFKEQPEPVLPDEIAAVLITAIEKEQDRLFGEDYLMDSKDCVDVIREEVERINACRAVMLQAGKSPVIPDDWQLVPKRLTAENGAKGALSGEFSETKFINCPECFGDEDCETCDGSGRIEISVPVSWTTIKAIWAKGVEHFSEAPQQEGK